MIMQTTPMYTYLHKYAIKSKQTNLKVSRDQSFTATKIRKQGKRFWHKRTLKILA